MFRCQRFVSHVPYVPYTVPFREDRNRDGVSMSHSANGAPGMTHVMVILAKQVWFFRFVRSRTRAAEKASNRQNPQKRKLK